MVAAGEQSAESRHLDAGVVLARSGGRPAHQRPVAIRRMEAYCTRRESAGRCGAEHSRRCHTGGGAVPMGKWPAVAQRLLKPVTRRPRPRCRRRCPGRCCRTQCRHVVEIDRCHELLLPRRHELAGLTVGRAHLHKRATNTATQEPSHVYGKLKPGAGEVIYAVCE